MPSLLRLIRLMTTASSAMGNGVVAVVVTYRRPKELARLMTSLEQCGPELIGVVVANHAPGDLALNCPGLMEVEVLDDETNPGPGAGWANAAAFAQKRFGERMSAILYLDDDVELPPGSLSQLCEEAARADADAIAPLLEDGSGRLWAFPEPQPRRLRKLIRAVSTPDEALRLLGNDPIPFCWCTGACFLVSRDTVSACGLHRRDFWILGEDLEYSMRVASQRKAVFTCKVSVPHLPPAPQNVAVTRLGGLVKFCSLLQNLSYLSFHSSDSAHMKSYLAGNFRRFLRTHGVCWRSVSLAATCFFNGAVCGEPAGGRRGERLRKYLQNHAD